MPSINYPDSPTIGQIECFSDTSNGSVSFITGNDESLSLLGISGFGLLEKYPTINLPFERK